MVAKVDLTGITFGRWSVLAQTPPLRCGATGWLCVCECGAEGVVRAQYLKSGKSRSCGCLRDELRPLIKRPPMMGDKNPRAVKSRRRNGDKYVPSSDIWYKRAAGVYYLARKTGTPLGFSSAVELASYVRTIAPDQCPVFKMPFATRGQGFNPWSPSIDKRVPALGYVPGNLQVISMLANCMKRDASPEQLRQFATWALEAQCP